jgi:hypothetical protein
MEDVRMLRFILATAVVFAIGRRTMHTDIERPAATSPDRSTSPRDRDAATRLADRALCGIDMPFVL